MEKQPREQIELIRDFVLLWGRFSEKQSKVNTKRIEIAQKQLERTKEQADLTRRYISLTKWQIFISVFIPVAIGLIVQEYLDKKEQARANFSYVSGYSTEMLERRTRGVLLKSIIKRYEKSKYSDRLRAELTAKKAEYDEAFSSWNSKIHSYRYGISTFLNPNEIESLIDIAIGKRLTQQWFNRVDDCLTSAYDNVIVSDPPPTSLNKKTYTGNYSENRTARVELEKCGLDGRKNFPEIVILECSLEISKYLNGRVNGKAPSPILDGVIGKCCPAEFSKKGKSCTT